MSWVSAWTLLATCPALPSGVGLALQFRLVLNKVWQQQWVSRGGHTPEKSHSVASVHNITSMRRSDAYIGREKARGDGLVGKGHEERKQPGQTLQKQAAAQDGFSDHQSWILENWRTIPELFLLSSHRTINKNRAGKTAEAKQTKKYCLVCFCCRAVENEGPPLVKIPTENPAGQVSPAINNNTAH